MGTRQNWFTAITVAGMTAMSVVLSGPSAASIMPGPTSPVLNAAASLDIFAGHSGQTLSLAKTASGSASPARGALEIGLRRIGVGYHQQNWTSLPESTGRTGVSSLSLGVFSSLQTESGVSFNGDTAVVLMESDKRRSASNSIIGSSFKAHPAEWSTFRTEWKTPENSESNSEWNPSQRPTGKYRTVSEFCPLDISKEFDSRKGCSRYSESIQSILRVMNNFMNWFKSLWSGSA